MKDSYNTIEYPSKETIYKEKNSKFIGYAYPIQSEKEVKPIIDLLRKQYPNAAHYCFAYQIGTETIFYKTNDDGEPSSTAGIPIYRQIQSFALTNVLVVIVRIFGGVKLGVGGLISAYKTSAHLTLGSCQIVEKTIDVHFQISFDYKNTNKVMRIIKEKRVEIITQKIEIDEDTQFPQNKIEIKTRKKNAEMVFNTFNSLFEIDIIRL